MKFSPKNFLKMKYNLNPILHNRVVLYFIALLALGDVVYFLGINDITSFVILLLVGILTSFFSKNMIVILVVAMVIAHIVKYGSAAYVSEGMENQDEDVKEPIDSKDSKKPDKKKSSENPVKNDKKDDKIKYADLKEDYKDFQNVQSEIVNTMKNIDPLLERAESFINKFESYKKQEGMKGK